MSNKKLKYREYLERFPDCPCSTKYSEVEMFAYRWVKRQEGMSDFMPLNLIKTPPQRILDDSDQMCKGYGLSMFLSLKLAAKKYNNLTAKLRGNLREKQVQDYGKEIALLNLDHGDGIAGDINSVSGHFTFHEYEDADLSNKIIEIFNIFDENGKFVIYQ
ncbi:hypothetical protein [Sphingobacterium chuzhouense]|uniref:Uncharacterized protein n=1 Tax=Sphingobacterium chuzhouense TaxID=1742264 RepID=A0ABR7XTL7_9SPHI|nr:hypothetical protein [Sphingobacterium chuzhouense]MBD1421622.1 hypothetical protein [Sphingobacterium chuzhouense]